MATVPSSILIDASAFIAVIYEKDRHHAAASRFYPSLRRPTRVVTTLLIVSETYTWLRYHVGLHAAMRFLDILREAVNTRWIEVVYPDEDIHAKAEIILRRYGDHKLSHSDAVTVALMQSRDMLDVFTFDSDFRIFNKSVWPGTSDQ